MNCQDFRQHVEDELLSHPEAAVERLRTHLARCDQAACRAFLEETLALEEAIQVWRDQTPQVDLTDGVLSRWKADAAVPALTSPPHVSKQADVQRRSPATPQPPASVRAWPVVLAVALLLMLLPLLVPVPSGTEEHLAEVPVPARQISGDESGSVDGAASVAEPHQKIVRERSIAYYNVAQQATRVVTDMVVLVLPDDDPSRQFEAPTRVPEWVGQWEEQIEPLKMQFDNAVRSLMNVLPEPMPPT